MAEATTRDSMVEHALARVEDALIYLAQQRAEGYVTSAVGHLAHAQRLLSRHLAGTPATEPSAYELVCEECGVGARYRNNQGRLLCHAHAQGAGSLTALSWAGVGDAPPRFYEPCSECSYPAAGTGPDGRPRCEGHLAAARPPDPRRQRPMSAREQRPL